MTIGTKCLAAVLVPGAALAGWSAECAAQAGSREQGVSLTAAVEEARRSPFHAVPVAAGPGEVLMDRSETHNKASLPHGPGRPETNVEPWVALLTYVTAGVSHTVANYMFWSCALDDSAGASAAMCFWAPVVPLVAVTAPGALYGAGLGKSVGASAAGLAVSSGAYLLGLIVTEQIDNTNPLVAGFASSAVHAAIVNWLLR